MNSEKRDEQYRWKMRIAHFPSRSFEPGRYLPDVDGCLECDQNFAVIKFEKEFPARN